ncbi:MAG: 3-dehydroquinate synthase [Candidatus Schekmanbacteria bacterium GWA2_38_9]|uniref:3-dehydroquinate synthase n=1 Tax=Candidatus Schekmanbacteria bacterium RIFCSPLOWO2_12_FULL_38_15 TaxID=1817883 RepID=A0A1F7SKE2_9BACT|nr:MAG: 3-dehydroquinate synthase [Candidatus Schekmanbacteria bacterium GWA2_38_9]OGL51282.1 MAG: 3-dehydroquinate synthase [Candidatus Schekmanbacteria bacterium RIFCSPLOWO2_02_FULL_38_14]OGL54233.1 MAG: 3-dehydroquinate synthase [Candidatus Schekmanbacteria bacterium RIFCSPLOWO2_12_FULL_38_15]
MKIVKVNLKERSYRILIGSGILKEVNALIEPLGNIEKVMIVTNPVVFSLYSKGIEKKLRKKYKVAHSVVPDGESSKSLKWARFLYDEMLKAKMERGSLVLAVGGGVIGDLAGFVASTYMRGVPYVQIPTTLLAQVDSSIGGKVAVNHPLGKNLIGSFYQPKQVIIDSDVLETLPQKEFKNGIAEIIKMAAIRDKNLFSLLEENINSISANKELLNKAIYWSCFHKARIVEEDEKESGLRAILNYGHTIGHAIESLGKYHTLKHGEAVLIGMFLVSEIAYKAGLCSKTVMERQQNLIGSVGLPEKQLSLPVKDIMNAMERDKKVKNGKIRFVLTKEIGSAIIRDNIPEKTVGSVLENFFYKKS